MLSTHVLHNEVSAGNCGGVAIVRCESGSVRESNISFNSARIDSSVNMAANGGGMCVELSSNLLIENSHFLSNLAASRGGGVEFIQVVAVTLTRCFFESNRAAFGGSIYLLNSLSVNISNDVFTDSYAVSNGGAIVVEESLSIVIAQSRFTKSICEIGYGSSIW